MGLPFIPARNMLGTDTLSYSSAKVVTDPWSGKPICLLPACYPDVAFIHVSRCDLYGNAQIDGTLIEDFELARAARRLIMTTEEIVPEEQIRDAPWRTVIPFFLVDAVVEVPYGCHPCQMPRRYYFDEDHIREWMAPLEDRRRRGGVFPGVRVRRARLRRLPGEDRRAGAAAATARSRGIARVADHRRASEREPSARWHERNPPCTQVFVRLAAPHRLDVTLRDKLRERTTI